MKKEYHGNCLTIYCNSREMAYVEHVPIEMVVRFDRRGRKYVWLYPSQKKVDDLIYKYGYEQIADGNIKGEDVKWHTVNCLWLNM